MVSLTNANTPHSIAQNITYHASIGKGITQRILTQLSVSPISEVWRKDALSSCDHLEVQLHELVRFDALYSQYMHNTPPWEKLLRNLEELIPALRAVVQLAKTKNTVLSLAEKVRLNFSQLHQLAQGSLGYQKAA